MSSYQQRVQRPRKSPARRPPRSRVVPRTTTDPRFTRRQKAIARSRRRRTIARTLAALLLLFVAWVVFFSPVLKVRTIDVVGARETSPEEVREVAALGDGLNILFLRTEEISQRVETLPWVESVDVDRMLPGTVRIRVKERSPALTLSLGAARWTIDAHGRVLSSGDAPGGRPVLAGVAVGTVRPGVELQTIESTSALEVWRSLPGSLKREVVAIFAPTIERITLTLEDGTLVRYGAPERMAGKNEVLEALLERLRSEGSAATYVDVRVPAHPSVSIGAPDGGAPPADALETP
jgi:cell division protein FtsQ